LIGDREDDRPPDAIYDVGTLTVRVDGRTTDRPRLLVGGELDLANVRRLRRLLASLIARRPRRIAVDLRDVDLVETISAAGLLRAQREAREDGVELTIDGARGSVAAVLRLASERAAASSDGDLP
jgi:anti-anti-sigma factor